MDATAYACRACVLYVFAASCWSPGLLRMATAAPVRSMSSRRAAGAPDRYVWRQLRRCAVCLCGELLEPRTATYGGSCAGTQYVLAARCWSPGLLRMAAAAPVRSMSLRRVPPYRTSAYGGCRDSGTGRQGPAMLSLESLQLPSIKFFRVLFRL